MKRKKKKGRFIDVTKSRFTKKGSKITTLKIKTKQLSIKYYKSPASPNRKVLPQFFNVNTATIMQRRVLAYIYYWSHISSLRSCCSYAACPIRNYRTWRPAWGSLWEQEKYPNKMREVTKTETEGTVPSSPNDSMLAPLFLPAPSPPHKATRTQ